MNGNISTPLVDLFPYESRARLMRLTGTLNEAKPSLISIIYQLGFFIICPSSAYNAIGMSTSSLCAVFAGDPVRS